MVFMIIVTVIAVVIQIALITIFIGAGVYYLAEFVEENTTFTKKCIKWIINIVVLCHIGLYFFDNMPFSVVASGLVSHALYYLMLSNFPYFSVTSLLFISSIISLIFSHVLAFKFFLQRFSSLLQILSYFTVCLWMVPFMYILSLSANDNTLPTTNINDNVVSHYFTNRNRSYKLKDIYSYFAEMSTKNDRLKY